MIDLFYWPTVNGHKVTMFLEEAGLPYRIIPVDIGKGDQFSRDFLNISPNNRMPAIVDHDPPGGAGPLSVFDSCAILLYLAEKVGRFIPPEGRERAEVLQWLFWQASGLGPMGGQNVHFTRYAPERIPYAIDRYVKETNRLFGVLDRRLADRPFIAGDAYSIADMAAYPWCVFADWLQQSLEDFPNVGRWLGVIAARPSTVSAYKLAEPYNITSKPMDESARQILFGQTAASTAAALRPDPQ